MLQSEQGDVLRRDALRMDLVVARFGNVPVLAEETAHVAAGGAHAEDAGTGKKMIQRFFFDRVNLQRGGRTISQAVELAAFIDANEAEPGLAGIDVAVARTEIAVHAAVDFRLPPARFVQGLSFLEDV